MTEFQPITTQADFDAAIAARINALKDAHKAALDTVRGELKAAQEWKAQHEPRLSRVAELEAEVAKRDRVAMFTAAGITDEKQIERLAKWYDIAREDFPEAERPDLAAWLKDHAPNDPTVGSLFQRPATPAVPAKPAATMPPAGKPSAPALTPSKLSIADVRAQHAKLLDAARALPMGSAERNKALADATAFLKENAAAS